MINRRFWGFALILALLTACNFTEEIFLEENGSGKISIHFDGSELMDMMSSMDSTKQEQPIDSLLVFKDLLEAKKDSISKLSPEEQAKLKKLEPFSMHMVMNPEENVLKFDLFSDFTNVAEVNDAFNAFQSASALGPTGDQDAASPPIEPQDASTEIEYAFSGNSFSRKAKIIDPELFQRGLDSLQGSEMFLSGSTYTLKYHFPKRVKSTTAEEATFSADGKTLIYQVPFIDLMKNPEILNLEVVLED